MSLFYVAFGISVFLAVVILFWLIATRRSRATTQRVSELILRGREPQEQALQKKQVGRRIFAGVHWLRARLGLAVPMTYRSA